MGKKKENWRPTGGTGNVHQRATSEPASSASTVFNASRTAPGNTTSSSSQVRVGGAGPSPREMLSSAVTVYDSRGAAIYICAVVSVYAAAVVLFVAVLVVVRRRQHRKSRDYGGAGGDDGPCKMAGYLASVAKLRQLDGELHQQRCRRPAGDGMTDKNVAAAGGPVRSSSDYFRSSFSDQLPVKNCRQQYQGAVTSVQNGGWSTLGPSGSKRSRPDFRHERLHGSMASLGVSATRQTSRTQPPQQQLNRRPADCSDGFWTLETSGRADGAPQRSSAGVGGGDDVITLIQVTTTATPRSVSHASSASKQCQPHQQTSSAHATPSSLTSRPAGCVTSSPAADAAHDGAQNGFVNRCRWSTGYNGDIWVLQMETDDPQGCGVGPADQATAGLDCADAVALSSPSTSPSPGSSPARHQSTSSTLSGHSYRFGAAIIPESRVATQQQQAATVSVGKQSDSDEKSKKAEDLTYSQNGNNKQREGGTRQQQQYSTDLIDLSVAHVIQCCREPAWSRLAVDRRWFSATGARAGAAGAGAAAAGSCYSRLAPEPPGDNEGGSSSSCYSTSRGSSSLQSPAEVQRLLHVTSV